MDDIKIIGWNHIPVSLLMLHYLVTHVQFNLFIVLYLNKSSGPVIKKNVQSKYYFYHSIIYCFHFNKILKLIFHCQ